jgi:hypothetical protein
MTNEWNAMPKWLEIYLNWWSSQTEKLTEMTLIDFVVSIPLALLPLVLLYWFVGGFKASKRTDKNLSQLKSPLFDMSGLKKAEDIANQKSTRE